MAKSLRSKTVLRAKSIKRKDVFQKIVDSRNQRISEKLNKDKEPKDESKMEEDKQEKKISTSGWRDSRKQQYKKRKTEKRNKSLKF